VKHFSEAFLLTYYTFITPSELISKLIYRSASRAERWAGLGGVGW